MSDEFTGVVPWSRLTMHDRQIIYANAIADLPTDYGGNWHHGMLVFDDTTERKIFIWIDDVLYPNKDPFWWRRLLWRYRKWRARRNKEIINDDPR